LSTCAAGRGRHIAIPAVLNQLEAYPTLDEETAIAPKTRTEAQFERGQKATPCEENLRHGQVNLKAVFWRLACFIGLAKASIGC